MDSQAVGVANESLRDPMIVSHRCNVMLTRETSGAPHNERSAPRFQGAAPGGRLTPPTGEKQDDTTSQPRYSLRFLIALLKKPR